jgi:hypothetical protein
MYINSVYSTSVWKKTVQILFSEKQTLVRNDFYIFLNQVKHDDSILEKKLKENASKNFNCCKRYTKYVYKIFIHLDLWVWYKHFQI